MSWDLWKKSGECCWVKSVILWSCSLTSESHISLRVCPHGSLPERPYKIKAELSLNPLTCLPAHTHTHTHTHTHISVHLPEQGTLQYWSGRTDWREQRIGMVRGMFLNISPFTKLPFLQKLREVCLDCYLLSTMFLHSLIFLVSCWQV